LKKVRNNFEMLISRSATVSNSVRRRHSTDPSSRRSTFARGFQLTKESKLIEGVSNSGIPIFQCLTVCSHLRIPHCKDSYSARNNQPTTFQTVPKKNSTPAPTIVFHFRTVADTRIEATQRLDSERDRLNMRTFRYERRAWWVWRRGARNPEL
jgi:hypothetical protein